VFHLIGFALTLAAVLIGYTQSKRFVQSRLRFVDSVHTLKAPILAGVIAGVVAAPIAALLPLIGIGTAVLFGLSVGAGVAAGARDIRRRIGAGEA
jgi:hypothetical protein